MILCLLLLFLLIVLGLTVGARQLSRFAGESVGRSTMRNHRIAEMIYVHGRIPRSWVSGELEQSGDDAEAHARDEADWRLRKLIKHFERSPAFADPDSRKDLLESLLSMQERIAEEPLADLIGPDPRLRRTVIFLDCGDTLADEGSEHKDENGVTLRANLIPGAARTVRELKRAGHTLALVADGPRGTFENILKPRRLWRLFDAYAISQEIGVSKPDPRMFLAALQELEITAEEYRHVVMVGNNLYRDIKGANDLGLTTVWIDWAPRRSKSPESNAEVPDFTVHTPLELLEVVHKLEQEEEPETEPEHDQGEAE